MKLLYFSLITLFVLSFPLKAQILNGGFEQWFMGEPDSWLSNNIDEPKLTLTPITQTSFAHGGSFALKGEVVEFEINGLTITYPPQVQAGNETVLGFPFTGQPKRVRGYYNFETVGGDAFVNNVFLMNGNDLLAVGGLTKYSSTGPGWHELVMDLFYIDSVTTPNTILFNFAIIPPTGTTETHFGSVFFIDDFPKMSLIKPPGEPEESGTGNLVFIAGEVDTIKWDGGGALNVNIEYSVDNGATYQQIVSSYPADSSRYFWAVPGSLLTRKAKIRIKESENTSNEINSVKFKIKPWQLTRLDANDKFELFEPFSDGWGFGNAGANVWPQSWWQQFVYQLGTDPITGFLYPFGPPFQTAQSSDFPDWPMFVDVFGTGQCYRNNPPSTYNSAATSRWDAKSSGWGGSCFGFAISSLIGFYYTGSLVNQFPGIGNFGALFNVPLSTDARNAINHFYIHQFGQEDTQHTTSHISDTPRQLLAELKKMFRKENGDGKALSFYNNNGSGGHTVVPYQLKRNGTNSTFNLRVYDSNVPGSSNQIIFIDSVLNQWTDNTGLGWGTGSSRCFLEPNSIDFLFRPTLKPTQLESKANKENLDGTSRLTIYNTSNAEIIITSGTGSQIGYQDSIAFNNISDAIPLIPKTGSFHPPIGYYLPEDNYSLQINNFTDSSSYAFFFTDSTIYNYRRFDASNNEVDELNFSESGVGITNPDPVDKNTILETIILEDSTSEKVFVTSNVKISAGDSIHIREKDRSELLLQNYGESMNYDLQARIASESGQVVFFHMAIPMDQNSAHQIVPDWNDLVNTPVTIYIDLGNDGTIDDTLTLKNQITNVEDQGNLYIPKEYKLEQNFPNPFNPTTTISYSIPKEGLVTIKIYNAIGEEVATIVNQEKTIGNYEIQFNAAALPSGIYFYRIQAGSFVETKKMVLMK